MRYKQTVLIRNVSLKNANETFNDIKFLKYLIALQPVKVIRWDGTYDGAIAHMRFWFFGWKDFIVSHEDNKRDENSFSFKDNGTDLPFGLTLWEHVHRVVKTDDNIKIIDEVFFLGKSSLVMFFVTPILILPIFLRKILYKTYTWN
jgi:ligand-binding SRPBCC domain-containing protein